MLNMCCFLLCPTTNDESLLNIYRPNKTKKVIIKKKKILNLVKWQLWLFFFPYFLSLCLYLFFLGVEAVGDLLDVSLLSLGFLLCCSQLQLRVSETLLQLLHTHTQTNKQKHLVLYIKAVGLQCWSGGRREWQHGFTWFLASLCLILACRRPTWPWAFCSSPTHWPAALSYWLSWPFCSWISVWKTTEITALV